MALPLDEYIRAMRQDRSMDVGLSMLMPGDIQKASSGPAEASEYDMLLHAVKSAENTEEMGQKSLPDLLYHSTFNK